MPVPLVLDNQVSNFTGNPPGPTLHWNDDFAAADAAGDDMQALYIIKMFVDAYNERYKAALETANATFDFAPPPYQLTGLMPEPVVGDDLSDTLKQIFARVWGIQAAFVPAVAPLDPLIPDPSLAYHGRDPRLSTSYTWPPSYPFTPGSVELVNDGFTYFGSRALFDNGVASIPKAWDRQYPLEIVDFTPGPIQGQIARWIGQGTYSGPFPPLNATKFKWGIPPASPPSPPPPPIPVWYEVDFKTTPTRIFTNFTPSYFLLGTNQGEPSPGDYMTGVLLNQLRDVLNKLVWTFAYTLLNDPTAAFTIPTGTGNPVIYWRSLETNFGNTTGSFPYTGSSDAAGAGSGAIFSAQTDFSSGAHLVTTAGPVPSSNGVLYQWYAASPGGNLSDPISGPGMASATLSASSAIPTYIDPQPSGFTRDVDFYLLPIESNPGHYVQTPNGPVWVPMIFDSISVGQLFRNKWTHLTTVSTANPSVASPEVNSFIRVGDSVDAFGWASGSDYGMWTAAVGIIQRYDVTGGFQFTKATV